MPLSNTATPIYYRRFRERVLSGELPVCKEISDEMNRIDAKIRNPLYYYDDEAINGFVDFCETEMVLTDGSDVKLLETYKLWAEDALAWFYFVEITQYVPNDDGSGGKHVRRRIKKRLTEKQYIITSRGSAKSLYASYFHSYFLTVDTTSTTQVAVAPTMRLAEETMGPIATAITISRGPLFKFLTEGSLRNTTGSPFARPKLYSSNKGIENKITNSKIEVRPMSIDKLQGLRVKLATVDEWLSGDTREDVVGALEQGANKVDGWFILAISSEGTVRNSIGDKMKEELTAILKGDDQSDQISIFYYKLDDVSEVANEEMWVKASPNIGKTISYEAYRNDVHRMEINPSIRNDVLAKRFGIPMEGYTYFFPYEETIPHSYKNFWGMPCSLGADLSQGDDFCAFTFLFPLDRGGFGVKTRSYITSTSYIKLQKPSQAKYDEFIREGTLHVMDGTILDMMEVYDDLDRHILEFDYDVRTFGYDPYNAKEFVERWGKENGEYGIEKVIQGAKTESVPLGELKHLSEERDLLFDEQLMSFAMGNCVVMEDTNGNRKLLKKRYDEKIDNVSALMDAFIAYKRNPDAFE